MTDYVILNPPVEYILNPENLETPENLRRACSARWSRNRNCYFLQLTTSRAVRDSKRRRVEYRGRGMRHRAMEAARAWNEQRGSDAPLR